MKAFSVHLKDITKELVLMKKELNQRLEVIDESDGNFERVETFDKRPIICWTYECNLLCSGCYAQKFKQDFSGQIMAADEFGKILDLFQRTLIKFEGVMLLGGEPTLPTTFSDLLFELEKRGLFASIYTNGVRIRNNTNRVFDRIIESPSIDQINIHFQTSYLKDNLYLERIKELKKSGKAVIARYDFHKMPEERDIDIILEKVVLLKLPLSWSFTHPYDLPRGMEKCDYIKPNKFGALLAKLHYFFEKASELGVELRMGIPVPLCIFRKEDLEKYQNKWELKFDCIGVGDVHPNGQMCQCTVVPQITTLRKIKTPKQLATVIRFFQENHKKLRENYTSFPWCNTGCRLSNPERYALCSGGCTAYRLYGDHH